MVILRGEVGDTDDLLWCGSESNIGMVSKHSWDIRSRKTRKWSHDLLSASLDSQQGVYDLLWYIAARFAS